MQQTPDNITTHSRVVNPKIPANGKKFSFQGGSVVAILTQEKKTQKLQITKSHVLGVPSRLLPEGILHRSRHCV